VGGACGTYGVSRGVYRVLVGNQRERDHLEDTGVDMSMIFRNWEVRVWIGSSWLSIGTDGVHL
jgi:hypothetical protein